MDNGKIVGGLILTVGVGLTVYYGFIKKFEGNLTGWDLLMGKQPQPAQPPANTQLNPIATNITNVLSAFTPIGKAAYATKNLVVVDTIKKTARNLIVGDYVGIVADDQKMINTLPAYTLKGTGELVAQNSVRLNRPDHNASGSLSYHENGADWECMSYEDCKRHGYSHQWCKSKSGNA